MKKKELLFTMGICLSFILLSGCSEPKADKAADEIINETTTVNSNEQQDKETIDTDINDYATQIGESIGTDIKDDIQQDENIVSSVITDDITQVDTNVISITVDNIRHDENGDVPETEDHTSDGEGDDAWEDGTNGTDFYDAESGIFRLYSYQTNEYLITLRLPESFSMSYADDDGTAYTIFDENYNIISVFGNAGAYAQGYISDGIIPAYYDKKTDSYTEYADYKCEVTDFPIMEHNSILVTESYSDSDGFKYKYNYFWIPYNDNEGNTQYIQFTVSDIIADGNTELSLETILTEMLDSE